MPKSQQSWGSVPVSSLTVESEGQRAKQCWIKYFKFWPVGWEDSARVTLALWAETKWSSSENLLIQKSLNTWLSRKEKDEFVNYWSYWLHEIVFVSVNSALKIAFEKEKSSTNFTEQKVAASLHKLEEKLKCKLGKAKRDNQISNKISTKRTWINNKMIKRKLWCTS